MESPKSGRTTSTKSTARTSTRATPKGLRGRHARVAPDPATRVSGEPSPPPSPPSEALALPSAQQLLAELSTELKSEMRSQREEMGKLRGEVASHKASLVSWMESIGRDVNKALASQSAAGVDETMIRLFPFT